MTVAVAAITNPSPDLPGCLPLKKIVVDGTYDPENDAYTGFEEQVVIDASDAGLSEEDADKLKERVTRHIDKGCTVKHTYVQETPVRMNVTVKH